MKTYQIYVAHITKSVDGSASAHAVTQRNFSNCHCYCCQSPVPFPLPRALRPEYTTWMPSLVCWHYVGKCNATMLHNS